MTKVTVFDFGKAIAEEQAKQMERLSDSLNALPVSTLADLADVLEDGWPMGTADLISALMRRRDLKVRVAQWVIKDGRCWHNEQGYGYHIGNTKRATSRKDSDRLPEGSTWLEAWIA